MFDWVLTLQIEFKEVEFDISFMKNVERNVVAQST